MTHPETWLPHDGGPRPVSPETMVRVKFRDGKELGPEEADDFDWCHDGFSDDFLFYLPAPASPVGVEKGEDSWLYKDALHELVMLHAQEDIGCVPAPTKEQWAKAWADAEDLVRVEP